MLENYNDRYGTVRQGEDDNMIWQELVRDQIKKLEKDKAKEIKRLDKIREDDSVNLFSKKVEIMANIKSITESITMLYILLGREREVNK